MRASARLMHAGRATVLGVLLTLAGARADAGSMPPQARVAGGVLSGVAAGDVVSFKGIPYAAPPVGELRWRPPQPVKPWAGVRPATTYGAICEQKYNAKDNGVGPLPQSEDCLTLSVFAPARVKGAPVMLWIHGGGYVNGSGTAALYDGTALARQGVVVVTINYRLGRFGFFAHPALTAEAGSAPVGNYALMDMIAALQWVQAHIAKFGGNPRNVTIFGESAGGVAVNDLMVSPAARGLFVRAIVQSGLGRERTLTLKAAEDAGEAFVAKLRGPGASAADLRQLSAEEILKAGDPDLFTGGGAMADGKILPEGPMEAFAKGTQARVPLIVGFNMLEFPVSPTAFADAFAKIGTAEQRERITSSYPTRESLEQHFMSDVLFSEPAVELARLHAASGSPTWVYQFSVLSKSAASFLKGAPHASDRQYVFQTLGASPWPTDANDAAQAKAISDYWTSFAKAGDPNSGGKPRWPRFVAADGQLLDFTNDGPVVTAIPRQAGMQAIRDTYAAGPQH